jgi:hypothetical protein
MSIILGMNLYKKSKQIILEIRDHLSVLRESETTLQAILESNRKIQGFGELGQDTVGILRHRANVRSAEFIEKNLEEASLYFSLNQLWDLALKNLNQSELILEFGVHSGNSINYFAAQTNRQIHGFDSFIGLPENWPGTWLDVGSFNVEGNLPKVPKHVTLHKGWFHETLGNFLQTHQGSISLVHIDSDIYSSAKYVLESIANRFVPGSLVLFDEHHGYVGWENGEFKAWNEFCESHRVNFKYVGFAQLAALIRIDSIENT